MKKHSVALFAVAAVIAISPAVLIGQNEDFTISINDNGIAFSGSGTFSTAQTYSAAGGGGTATDGYLINSFSGTLTATGAPAAGTVTLIPSTNPGGNFLVGGNINADNLLFLSDDVAGAGSGYLDNSGMVVALGAYDVNIFTGQTIYVGAAGLPYWVFFNIGGYNASTTMNPTVSLSVPEFGSLTMLIVCALALAGAFFYKGRQSGLFLNS